MIETCLNQIVYIHKSRYLPYQIINCLPFSKPNVGMEIILFSKREIYCQMYRHISTFMVDIPAHLPTQIDPFNNFPNWPNCLGSETKIPYPPKKNNHSVETWRQKPRGNKVVNLWISILGGHHFPRFLPFIFGEALEGSTADQLCKTCGVVDHLRKPWNGMGLWMVHWWSCWHFISILCIYIYRYYIHAFCQKL